MNGQIYLIRYKPTNRVVYVGQTKNTYQRRWDQHRHHAQDLSRKAAINNAIRKYGADSFQPELIEECAIEDMDDRERFWIQEFHTKVEDGGYNLTDGGDSPSVTTMCVPVYQYDLDGNYLADYFSMIEAQRAFGKPTGTSIFRAARGSLKQAYGFQWSVDKVDCMGKYSPSNKSKAVEQYTIGGDYIQTFVSINEAARSLGKPPANISAAALGKRNTAYGYIWKYVP